SAGENARDEPPLELDPVLARWKGDLTILEVKLRRGHRERLGLLVRELRRDIHRQPGVDACDHASEDEDYCDEPGRDPSRNGLARPLAAHWCCDGHKRSLHVQEALGQTASPSAPFSPRRAHAPDSTVRTTGTIVDSVEKPALRSNQ